MSNTEKTSGKAFGEAFDAELKRRCDTLDDPKYEHLKSLTRGDAIITLIICVILTIGLAWSLL